MPIAQRLLPKSPTIVFPLLAAALLVFARLGAPELWTLEGRWAAITSHMLSSHDYFHPYLYGEPYYDKPLLSYWLMIFVSRISGALDEWSLRAPGALSGVLAVGCTYRLGRACLSRETGMIAASLLATCFMFVFWSRVASADMLNLAGTVAAVTWYFERRDQPGFSSYAVFFLILALTCLAKGLVAVIAPLVLIPELISSSGWRRHLRPSMGMAILVGLAVYMAPFLISSVSQGDYGVSGLSLVVRENIVRYVDPFDHREPVYVYFLYLPVYLLPWSLLLPWVVSSAVQRWKTMSPASRWPIWASLLIFGFLTASGSRRSYYILPILPFATLVIAEWLQSKGDRVIRIAATAALASWALMLVWFGLIAPYSFTLGGERLLAKEARAVAERKAPWGEWGVLQCGAPPSVGYYFQTRSEAEGIAGDDREGIRSYLDKHPRTVLVTKRKFLETVRSVVPEASMIEERPRIPKFLGRARVSDRDLVALIP